MGWHGIVVRRESPAQFLFLRTIFKPNVLSELEPFGRFWAEDRVSTFPSIEPIGLADW